MNGKPASTANGAAESELYVGVPEATAAERAAETALAQRLAERYRLEFVDLVALQRRPRTLPHDPGGS